MLTIQQENHCRAEGIYTRMPVCWQTALQIQKSTSMERVNITVNQKVFKNNNYT